jgi:hypothetical protein
MAACFLKLKEASLMPDIKLSVKEVHAFKIRNPHSEIRSMPVKGHGG